VIALLLQLFLILPAHTTGNPPSDPFCAKVAARSLDPLDVFLDAVDKKEIIGKEGKVYRVLTRSADYSEEKLNSLVFSGTESVNPLFRWEAMDHNLEIVDAAGVIVGFASFRQERDAIKLQIIHLRQGYRNQGLTTQMFKEMARTLPSGSAIKFLMVNDESTAPLEALTAQFRATPEYLAIRAERGKLGAQDYLSAEITKYVNMHYDPKGPLWINLAQKSGFQTIRVEVSFEELPDGKFSEFFELIGTTE